MLEHQQRTALGHAVHDGWPGKHDRFNVSGDAGGTVPDANLSIYGLHVVYMHEGIPAHLPSRDNARDDLLAGNYDGDTAAAPAFAPGTTNSFGLTNVVRSLPISVPHRPSGRRTEVRPSSNPRWRSRDVPVWKTRYQRGRPVNRADVCLDRHGRRLVRSGTAGGLAARIPVRERASVGDHQPKIRPSAKGERSSRTKK